MTTIEVRNYSEYYELAYQQITKDYIKVCVFLGIICVIGILGNSLTITFYLKQPKFTINVLILVLSFVDLKVSLLTFAMIYEHTANIKLESSIACRTMYFIYYWFIGLSISLVVFIAIERYRGICMQKRSHTASKRVKWVIASCSVVMMVISLRAFWTVDINPVKYQFHDIFIGHSTLSLNNTTEELNSTVIPDVTSRSLFPGIPRTDATESQNDNSPKNVEITVHICSFSRSEERKTYVVITHIFDVIFITTVIAIFIFCYSSVLKTLVIHRKMTKWLHEEQNMARNNARSKLSTSHETSTTGTEASHSEPVSVNGMEQRHFEHSVVTESNTIETSSDSNNRRSTSIKGSKESVTGSTWKSGPRLRTRETVSFNLHRDKVKASEVQITLAMFTVSILLLISFVPYFFAVIYIQYLSSEDAVFKGTTMIMIRCSMINSVLNCFVYYIFSSPYRVYVNSLLCFICQRIRQKVDT